MNKSLENNFQFYNIKKYEIIVEDSEAAELTTLLEKLPYVKQVKESKNIIDNYTLASEQSLAEAWLLEEDDELKKLYGISESYFSAITTNSSSKLNECW